jgi:enoyl-CoA hydratase/carnithine racemase
MPCPITGPTANAKLKKIISVFLLGKTGRQPRLGSAPMRPVTFDQYRDRYETLRMTRTPNGVLEVALHTNGESLVFARNIHEELGFAFADIAADRENKAVIVTGTGETFCNRFDPESFVAFGGLGPDITPGGWDQTFWRGLHNVRAQLDVPVPMIGVLNGPATAHSEIALLCDIVLASDTATIQDEPHFGNGVAPGDGVHVMFPLLLGPTRGRYFLLTQQTLGAAQALDLGLVNEVHPRGAVLARAHELAANIASKPALAVRYARMLMTQQLKRMFDEALPLGLAVEGLSAIEVFQLARDGQRS